MIAPRSPRPRAGITLTEILIAILIMGVGLISLATLFPLGLIRLREATRNARGGLLFEVAADDMDARQLLFKPNFTDTWYWVAGPNNTKIKRDPFLQDAINADPTGCINATPYGSTGVGLKAGLPICYDPLWRSLTGIAPNSGLYDPTLYADSTYFAPSGPQIDDARFGSGIFAGNVPYLRPTDSDGSAPSAYGLQRITNFIPWNNTYNSAAYRFTCRNFLAGLGSQPGDVAGDIFASNDDILFNATGGAGNRYSSVLPDMTSAGATQLGPQVEYRFTWFFTGKQADDGANSSQFVGDIVVCDGRPFGYDPLPGGGYSPTGETVVEGVFGVAGTQKTSTLSTLVINDRAVTLRWNATLPDPEVRAGGWIADVTYEPYATQFASRVKTSQGASSSASPNGTTFARCYWYQVAKKSDVQPDPTYSGYRSMTVTLTAPVRTRTALDSSGNPLYINTALIMPSVISVYPRAFEVH